MTTNRSASAILPHAHELPALPVRTDEELLDRVQAIIRSGIRRQLWFLLLDERDCQLPVVMPMDIPVRPRPAPGEHLVDAATALAAFIDLLVETSHAAKVVIVYERPGAGELRPADLAWVAHLAEVDARAATPLRAVVMASARRFRVLHSDRGAPPASGSDQEREGA